MYISFLCEIYTYRSYISALKWPSDETTWVKCWIWNIFLRKFKTKIQTQIHEDSFRFGFSLMLIMMILMILCRCFPLLWSLWGSGQSSHRMLNYMALEKSKCAWTLAFPSRCLLPLLLGPSHHHITYVRPNGRTNGWGVHTWLLHYTYIKLCSRDTLSTIWDARKDIRERV